MSLTRRCSVCKEEKSLDNYFNSSKGKYGKGYRCKDCDREARRQSRNQSENTRLGYRRRVLSTKYGLTVESYDRMLASQHGACAICGTTNPLGEGNITAKRSFSFAVDHCHETGRIRGLLCNPCNRGIGFLRDSPAILLEAFKYICTK